MIRYANILRSDSVTIKFQFTGKQAILNAPLLSLPVQFLNPCIATKPSRSPQGNPGRFWKARGNTGHSRILLRTLGSRVTRFFFFCIWPHHWQKRGKHQGEHPRPCAAYSTASLPPQVAEVMLRVPGSPVLALCCSKSFLFWVSEVKLKPFNSTTYWQLSLQKDRFSMLCNQCN